MEIITVIKFILNNVKNYQKTMGEIYYTCFYTSHAQ